MAQIESSTTQARQGSKGRPALYVLIGSVLLAAVAGAVALSWQSASSPPDHAAKSQEAARGTATGGSTPSGSGAAGVTGGNPVEPSPAQPKAN